MMDCPLCGSEMVIRTSQYGEFYGCKDYPNCKGTRKIDKKTIVYRNNPSTRFKVDPSLFEGLRVVITGEIDGHSREGIIEELKSAGASVSSTLNAKTDVLLVGFEPGSKLSKAQDLGIKILYSSHKIEDAIKYSNQLKLTSIIIPEGITYIKDKAYSNHTALKSITIPDSVTSIGDSAFSGCSSLKSITIPESVTSIGDSAFSECSSLKSITIPESVTCIGDSTFSGCISLTSIIIPESVTNIGDSAFDECTSLKSITIPESVTNIGDSAFSSCTSLRSITIPDKINSIKFGAFSNCSLLTSLIIPNNVTRIELFAFSGCSSLRTVKIPDNVVDIQNHAFSGCSSLHSIEFPKKLCSIGGFAFSDCVSLASITIPDGVTDIGNEAFSRCSSLSKITIPNNVTGIGDDVLEECNKLQFFYVSENEKLNNRVIGNVHGMFPNHLSIFLTNTMKTKIENVFACNHGDLNKFDFNNYDSMYSKQKADEKSMMAFYRLKQPINLNEESRKIYESTVKRRLFSLIDYFVEINEVDEIKHLVEFKAITSENIDKVINQVLQIKNAELMAFLLSYKMNNVSSSKVKKEFHLSNLT